MAELKGQFCGMFMFYIVLNSLAFNLNDSSNYRQDKRLLEPVEPNDINSMVISQ